MYLKKIFYILLSSLCLCSSSMYLIANEAPSVLELDGSTETEYPEFILNDAVTDIPDIPYIPDRLPPQPDCGFANQIVPMLNECGIINILKQNFFLKTSNLNKRSLLDYYTTLASAFPTNDQVLLKASAFWNATPRNKFTASSEDLDSYLALQDDAFVGSIQTVFNNIKNNPDCNEFFIGLLGLNPTIFDTNIKKVLCLFSGVTTQERRAGVMIEGMKNFDRWTLGFKTPFLLQERNFFITPEEVDEIDEAFSLPPANQDQVDQFAQSHLISDRIGLGDTRLFASYQPLDKYNIDLQLGVFATAPTSLPVQKGYFGTGFKKKCLTLPEFDLCAILNLGLSADALEHQLKHDFSILADEFLDRLSANLLEDDLGNGQHWGIGIFVEPTFDLSNHWSWHTRASFEYLAPGTESRFFIKDVNKDQFNSRDFSSDDVNIAAGNLRFLNNRLLEMFFPSSFEVLVRPGQIAMLTSDLTFQGNNWWVTLGNDFWCQTKEHIDFTPDQSGFDTCKVFKPLALQYKVFGGISRAFYREDSGWLLSAKFDATVASIGIGRDYTVVLGATTTW